MPVQQSDEEAGAGLSTLVKAQAAVRSQLTDQAIQLAASAATKFHRWYDTDAITEWATKLADSVGRLQRLQARSTDAYLARALSQMTGQLVRPIGAVDVDSLRTGVTHPGVYGRGADVYRYQQSLFDRTSRLLSESSVENGVATHSGQPVEPPAVDEPAPAAHARLLSVAEMDIQLADRAQTAQVFSHHEEKLDIRGWRRVIHPERSKGGTCGLCIAASDRIYHVDELRPIHGRCECTSLPIIGSQDPGGGLNNLDLKTLYQHAGDTTSGIALKRTRYKVDDHGELGPVLTSDKDSFRGPKTAERDTNKTGRPKTPEQTRQTLERLLSSLEPAQGRSADLVAGDPKKWGAYARNLDARVTGVRSQLAALSRL